MNQKQAKALRRVTGGGKRYKRLLSHGPRNEKERRERDTLRTLLRGERLGRKMWRKARAKKPATSARDDLAAIQDDLVGGTP